MEIQVSSVNIEKNSVNELMVDIDGFSVSEIISKIGENDLLDEIDDEYINDYFMEYMKSYHGGVCGEYVDNITNKILDTLDFNDIINYVRSNNISKILSK